MGGLRQWKKGANNRYVMYKEHLPEVIISVTSAGFGLFLIAIVVVQKATGVSKVL